VSDEKTEPATDHKRQEARKSGQVLKSQDVVVTFMLFGLTYSLNFAGQNAFKYLYGFFVEAYENLALYTHYDLEGILGILLKACLIIVICCAPLAAIAFVLTWLGNLLQVGFNFTAKPLNPTEGFKKINPIKGVKNLFSMKKVIELVKSLIKLVVIGWLAYGVVKDALGQILLASGASVGGGMGLVGSLAMSIVQKIAYAMIAIMILDYGLQKWQFEKSLKMSKQEQRDEYKKLEGDPHVKARIRHKQMEMAMNAGRGSVSESDVVVVNPTHYAVALQYKPKRGQKAPVVLAKGKNAYALEIRRIAEENFILIVEDPPTARMLYAGAKVDEPIPPEMFQAVAKIIALLYKGRRRPQAPQPVLAEMPVAPIPLEVQEALSPSIELPVDEPATPPSDQSQTASAAD
jgi:flagellar biosynthetic protein FlhB